MNFTSRMRQAEQVRSSVSDRVQTLKRDCAQAVIPPSPYCYNGRTWYDDNVAAGFNGWITEVQSDLTANNSLGNITSYDLDLQNAVKNAGAFNTWVDQIHTYFSQGGTQSGGANGGPSVGEFVPPIVEAGATIWKQYQAGQQAKTDRLKSEMDTVRFASYDDA